MSTKNLATRSGTLRNGEKNLRDNVPIRINDWANAGAAPKDTVPKSALVKFSVLTNNHGVGGTGKFSTSSFGTKTALKLDLIEDNPRSTIQCWQSIFNELLPAMPDVSPLTAVELFQAYLTGTATKEFEQILFDSAGELYDKYIDVEYNRRISKYSKVDFINAAKSIADIDALGDAELVRAAKDIKPWQEINDLRVAGRKNIPGISSYAYSSHSPPRFPRPPAKPKMGQFAGWNPTGVSCLSPCAWLRMHNHGWEYAEKFLTLVFNKVQTLAFKQYGAHAGSTQLSYLTEDLELHSSHELKYFFRLVQSHSEAMPYYPPIPMEPEVGVVFSDARKIQIVWNACSTRFHRELVNLNVTRKEDFRGSYEDCKAKFLLAEMHHKSNILNLKDDTKTGPGKGNPSNSGKKKKGNPLSKEKGEEKKSKPLCTYCGGVHWAANCYSNPNSANYRNGTGKTPGSGTSRNNANAGKNRSKGGADAMSFEEFRAKKDKEAELRDEYNAYLEDPDSFEEN